MISRYDNYTYLDLFPLIYCPGIFSMGCCRRKLAYISLARQTRRVYCFDFPSLRSFATNHLPLGPSCTPVAEYYCSEKIIRWLFRHRCRGHRDGAVIDIIRVCKSPSRKTQLFSIRIIVTHSCATFPCSNTQVISFF